MAYQKVYKGSIETGYGSNNFYLNYSRKYTDRAFSYFNQKDELFYVGSGWMFMDDSYWEKWSFNKHL